MIISDKHCIMVGHQFTPEQRNCMVMAYERNKENFKNPKNYDDQSSVPLKRRIRFISFPVDPINLDQKIDPPPKIEF